MIPLQYEYLHTNNLPDDREELRVPEEEYDAVWDMLLPGDMDLNQFSKSDPWIDLSAYTDHETAGQDATKRDSCDVKPIEETATGKKPRSGSDHTLMRPFPFTALAEIKSYQGPPVILNGPELTSMVMKHKNNLFEIWKEVTPFLEKLTEQLYNKHSRHPVSCACNSSARSDFTTDLCPRLP